MPHPSTSTIQIVEFTPPGAFDLRRSVEFGFGQRDARPFTGTMPLAFCTDGADGRIGPPLAVTVRQRPSGAVECALSGRPPDLDAAVAQVARVLSLDVDSRGWDELCRRDPLLGRLRSARPGLRPPLFHSAYEAALWVVLSARRPHQQAAAMRERLSRTHGTVFTDLPGLPGQRLAAVPTPEQLLEVTEFPGLPDQKLRRLHSVARAALAGRLDTRRLRALEPVRAMQELRELDGVGPYYAELIVVRALGHTDVLPRLETRMLGLAGRLTGKGGDLTPDRFAELAEAWRPWRTWAAVTIRAAGPTVLAATAGAGAA